MLDFRQISHRNSTFSWPSRGHYAAGQCDPLELPARQADAKVADDPPVAKALREGSGRRDWPSLIGRLRSLGLLRPVEQPSHGPNQSRVTPW
jgi:hypothetical protein